MNGFKKWAEYAIPWRLGPLGWVLIIAHTCKLLRTAPNFTLSTESLFDIPLSYITLLTFFQLINLPVQNRRLLKVGTNLLFFLAYALLSAYEFDTSYSLDYRVVADNIREAASKEALGVILSSLSWGYLIVAGAALTAFSFLEYRSRFISGTEQRPPLTVKFVVCSTFYISAVVWPSDIHEGMTGFIKSAVHYYLPKPSDSVSVQPGTYPYLRKADPSYPARLPPVFVICVESFNAEAVSAKIAGRAVMPYMNLLMTKGLSVKYFYANSIQTAKGQLAILASLLPSMRGKVFRHHPNLSLQGLPRILGEAGYRTLMFDGCKDKSFDNTDRFMPRLGFDMHYSVDEFLTTADRAKVWGWGPEDALLYRKLFGMLDRSRTAESDKPLFVFVQTINNHMFFRMPPSRRLMIKNPRNLRERYMNSVHLVDRGLRVFFAELRRRPEFDEAVVVITGDHPYPLVGNGTARNETGFHDESFRTPILILAPGRVEPRRISDRAASQMDIAPTILALLSIHPAAHHFQGRSLLSNDTGPVFTVQPYGGTYLSVIRFPFKLIKHLSTGKRWLFNLVRDPGEQRDLMTESTDPVLSAARNRLIKDLSYFYKNQYLIENDQIFPARSSDHQPRL